MAISTFTTSTGDLAASANRAVPVVYSLADRSTLPTDHPAFLQVGDVKDSRSLTVSTLVIGANAAAWSALGESPTLTPTTFSSAAITQAAAAYGVLYQPTAEFKVAGLDGGLFDDPVKIAAEGILGKQITIRDLAYVAGATASTGVSTSVELTWDDVLEMRYLLQANHVQGPFLLGLSDKQWFDLQIDSLNKVSPNSVAVGGALIGSAMGVKGVYFDDITVVVTSGSVQTSGSSDVGFMAGVNGLQFSLGRFGNPSPQSFNLDNDTVRVVIEEDAATNSTKYLLESIVGVGLGQSGACLKLLSPS